MNRIFNLLFPVGPCKIQYICNWDLSRREGERKTKKIVEEIMA